jgi:phosphoglycerol transferase MdoB-like AlkP superfamily enzyme
MSLELRESAFGTAQAGKALSIGISFFSNPGILIFSFLGVFQLHFNTSRLKQQVVNINLATTALLSLFIIFSRVQSDINQYHGF